MNFCRLKKGQILNKSSKISRPTAEKKAKLVIFGLEKANANLATLAQTSKQAGGTQSETSLP